MASSKKPRRKSRSPAKKSSAKASPPPKPWLVTRVLRSVWRPLPLSAVAVAVSVVMFWPQIVERVPDLSRRPEYQLPWSQVLISTPGRWVPREMAAQVRQMSGLPDPLPLLDETLTERLALAFAQHPWVAEVRSVAKTGPRSLRVDVTYRKPVLMVRTKRGLYPVDHDGVLLPPSDFVPVDAERFPIAEGVRSVPGGPAGTAWGDQAVRGAARLAEVLIRPEEQTSAWERSRMAAIQILEPSRPAESLEQVTLGVTTSTGSQIVWGRPPGADSLEPTVEQKLLRLEKYLPEHGENERSRSPVRLDVRQWDVVEQQQLSRNPGLDRARR